MINFIFLASLASDTYYLAFHWKTGSITNRVGNPVLSSPVME